MSSQDSDTHTLSQPETTLAAQIHNFLFLAVLMLFIAWFFKQLFKLKNLHRLWTASQTNNVLRAHPDQQHLNVDDVRGILRQRSTHTLSVVDSIEIPAHIEPAVKIVDADVSDYSVKLKVDVAPSCGSCQQQQKKTAMGVRNKEAAPAPIVFPRPARESGGAPPVEHDMVVLHVTSSPGLSNALARRRQKFSFLEPKAVLHRTQSQSLKPGLGQSIELRVPIASLERSSANPDRYPLVVRVLGLGIVPEESESSTAPQQQEQQRDQQRANDSESAAAAALAPPAAVLGGAVNESKAREGKERENKDPPPEPAANRQVPAFFCELTPVDRTPSSGSPQPHRDALLTKLNLKASHQLLATDNVLVELQDLFGLEDDSTDCLICFAQTKDIILLPCRHVCLCHLCFKSVKKCPVCRSQIVNYMRFMPREELVARKQQHQQQSGQPVALASAVGLPAGSAGVTPPAAAVLDSKSALMRGGGGGGGRPVQAAFGAALPAIPSERELTRLSNAYGEAAASLGVPRQRVAQQQQAQQRRSDSAVAAAAGRSIPQSHGVLER